MDSVPKEIRYDRVIPRGFPCIFKEWIVDPLTNTTKTWLNNEIVRFTFGNSYPGVFDPMRSCIEITVSTNEEETPIGLLQVDNSAQSFIQTLVITSNNVEVERVHEYGALGAYLNDCGLNEFVSEGREQEGLGYGSFDTMPYHSSQTSSTAVPKSTAFDIGWISNAGFMQPNRPSRVLSSTDIPEHSKFRALKSSNNISTGVNPFFGTTQKNWGEDTTTLLYQKCFNETGFYTSIRGEYLANFTRNNYIESTKSIPCGSLELEREVFLEGGYNATSFVSPRNIDGKIIYKTIPQSTVNQKIFIDTVAGSQIEQEIRTSSFGYANLFSPSFSRGTFEPFISPTVRQGMMYKGRILQTKEPLYRRKFKIPILSATIGILIDQSQFTLLPLQSLATTALEITLDPYAMFTSGYKDISEMDLDGMSMQQKRNWSVDRIQYKMHTYHYLQEEVQSYIQTSLYREIHSVNNFWILSAQHRIPGGQTPNNSYFVNCKSPNLNNLACIFMPLDYQTYSFCRKHYRISNNVTSFNCKLGVEYWPPQPYRGNGGNPCSNDMEEDNSIFVENIYYAGSYMFSTSVPLPRINIYNFALNERPYAVENRNSHFSPEMLNDKNYKFTDASINADTALGNAWIHENRCVGKAAYVISFTPYSDNENFLKGINVSGISNFEVCFECDPENVFERDQVLLAFCRCSVLVKYTENGIETIGR